MKRRDLFKLIAATVAGWPIRAHGQQATPRHVGVMLGLAKGPDDPGANEILRPLMASMRDMGWAEDKNLRVSTRFGGGERARIDAAADDLVALAPELIYVTGLPPAQALRKRTPTIPIVFSLVADPVGFGLVESLSRPGGNVTGFVVWDLSIGGKWIQLLQEIAPNLDHIGIMFNPETGPYAPGVVASAKASAAKNAIVAEYHTRNAGDIESATAQLGSRPNSGLIVIPEPFTNANRDKIITYCNQFKVPALNPLFGAATRGALMSYTYAFDTMIRQSATYIDRVLRGELPRNLPVQAPTRYELSINLGVARTLGLNLPSTVLALADQVID